MTASDLPLKSDAFMCQTMAMKRAAIGLAIIVVALGFWLMASKFDEAPAIEADGDPKRGDYVLRMAGCVGCHTDSKNQGEFLAGGRALKTDFGTFYTSNITPDTETGIGGWTTGEFVRALKEGLSPDGDHYYPAFPYPSYANMTDQDLIDLKAYLDTVEAVNKAVPDHDLGLIFSFRPVLTGWKFLFFEGDEYQADPDQSDQWNRGA
ncbi:MAG: c-type cytochrome, partial [Geminicoccaceae bacterium]